MKIRTGFVSNSSSMSFIMNKRLIDDKLKSDVENLFRSRNNYGDNIFFEDENCYYGNLCNNDESIMAGLRKLGIHYLFVLNDNAHEYRYENCVPEFIFPEELTPKNMTEDEKIKLLMSVKNKGGKVYVVADGLMALEVWMEMDKTDFAKTYKILMT